MKALAPKAVTGHVRMFQRQPNGIIIEKGKGLSGNKALNRSETVKVEPSINWAALSSADKKKLITFYEADNMQQALKIVHKITSKTFCVGCGGLTMLRVYLSQQVPTWRKELNA